MKKILSCLLILSVCYSSVYKEGDFIKQKAEIKKLKNELDEFYKLKEDEYKKQKQELQKILNDIKKEKKDIEQLKKDNEELLSEIRGEILNKTIKIYNKAKPKVVASIFKQMLKDGKIEEVFDIIVKMKTKNVTSLLKFLEPKDASLLTQKLIKYKKTK